jgi:hypothetical protein
MMDFFLLPLPQPLSHKCKRGNEQRCEEYHSPLPFTGEGQGRGSAL